MRNIDLIPVREGNSSMVKLAESTPREVISLENAFDAKLEKFMTKLIDGGVGDLYSLVVHEIEKRLIKAVLIKTKGNQVKASRILGINRNTLRKKMSMFEISQKKIKELVRG